VSFLRYFILQMPNKKYSICKKISNFINNENKKDRLHCDVSSNSIHRGWLVFLVVMIIWLTSALLLVPVIFNFVDNSKIRWVISIVLVPIFLTIIIKMVSIQKTNKSIESLDDFSNILDEKIKDYKEKKGIIIFVDDLDRVSPRIAREVLDNLRTFFDKEYISFIVTGDHTVLERSLGKELVPDLNPAEQLEEGKRFLKKIFNVYWRLPLPIDPEMDIFLDDLFKEKISDLNIIFKNDDNLIIFKKYLKKYFDKNFRQIIRFIDSVIFTFNIINSPSDEKSDNDNKYFEDLKNNPLLVVRILMIQELCSPLFELIVNDFENLSKLEYAADKQDLPEVNKIFDEMKDSITNSQRSFIEKFIFESPRFFENRILTVSDLRPFIYLAADSGFGDSRGPSSKDFSDIFNSEDVQQIKQALIGSGQKRLKEGVSKFIEIFSLIPDSNRKYTVLIVIFNVLLDIPEYKEINDMFFENIKKLDFAFLIELNPEKKSGLNKIFRLWLDKFNNYDLEEYNNIFVFFSPDDIKNIELKEGDKIGYFGSSILSNWFIQYYKQNSNDALSIFYPKIEFLNDEAVKKGLQDLFVDIINTVVSESNSNYRDLRFNLLIRFANQASIDLLKDKIYKEISKLNHEMWGFISSETVSSTNLFPLEYFESAIIDSLNNSQGNFETIFNILNYASNKLKLKVNDFWDIIESNYSELFVDNINRVIDSSTYLSIAPDSGNAGKLFYKLLSKIKNSTDDNFKFNALTYLNRSKWLWSNLNKVDNRKFGSLKSGVNQNIINNVISVVDSWGK
ncbi:MAG: P-loop NTPase fold protein, partial [Patescibacteria group bacterium]